jgi:hypothetical protein
MRHSPLHRTLTLVYALLHLVVPQLVAVADGRQSAEAANAHPTAHAESHGSPRCPRVHPMDCGLCQVIATFALPARAEPTSPPAPARIAVDVAPLLGDDASGRFALALPRAPPAS